MDFENINFENCIFDTAKIISEELNTVSKGNQVEILINNLTIHNCIIIDTNLIEASSLSLLSIENFNFTNNQVYTLYEEKSSII